MSRRYAWLLLTALFLALGAIVALRDGAVARGLWTVGVIVTGLPLVTRTVADAIRGRFATDIVASLSIIGAVLLGQPLAGLVIVLMQTGGEALEHYAERKASAALEQLERAAPRVAHVEREGGARVARAPSATPRASIDAVPGLVGISLTKNQLRRTSSARIPGRKRSTSCRNFSGSSTGHGDAPRRPTVREVNPQEVSLMKTPIRFGLAALFVAASSVAAQSNTTAASTTTAPASDSTAKAAPKTISLYRPLDINHIRPADQRGVNVFESPKEDQVPFSGFALSFGGAFTQEFQGLAHSNNASAVMVNNVNQNQLMTIGHGFNNAVANLNVNAQVAPGIRVAMTSYLSARHHQESWVKDGYLLIDESPIDNPMLKSMMKYTTVRIGHFEINYGDSHFRRSDNGNSMDNPFVGNYILDDFTTEIGAEAYVRPGPWIAMLGVTGGEIHGQVTAPQSRSASVLGKLGFDKKLSSDLRVRLTGSFYANNSAASNTLFTGDRGGSAYYDVLENTASTETANAWSGQIRPGFSNKVNAQVINPFVKYYGFEFFGNFETAKGGAWSEGKLRNLRQQVYEALYRFGPSESFYVGTRYNNLTGQLIAKNWNDETVDRVQTGGGWFVTPNVLAKLEYVNQTYGGFPAADIRRDGHFKGFMISGVVGF
jgi:hypothetical protein